MSILSKHRVGQLSRALIFLTISTVAPLTWGQNSPKRRVAVFDFDNAAVQGGVSSPYLQTNTPELGKGVSEI